MFWKMACVCVCMGKTNIDSTQSCLPFTQPSSRRRSSDCALHMPTVPRAATDKYRTADDLTFHPSVWPCGSDTGAKHGQTEQHHGGALGIFFFLRDQALDSNEACTNNLPIISMTCHKSSRKTATTSLPSILPLSTTIH